jgi:MFS family permease
MATGITRNARFYGWTNLTTACVMGVVGGFYLVSFGMFLPFLIKEFGWNRGYASLAATINIIIMGVCGPLAGAFIMKYGAKRSIVMGNCIGFIGFALLCFHSRLWELFLAYGILIGVGAGFGGLLASTTVINNWFVRKRRMALSIFLGSGGAAGIFMGPLMMHLITGIGWRRTYLVIAASIFVFSFLVPAIFIKNKPQDLGQVPDGVNPASAPAQSYTPKLRASYKTPVDFTAKEAMRTRSLWLLIIYFSLSMLAIQALMTHLVAHMFDIGISPTKAAFAMSIMSALMTFAQFILGFVGLRYSVHTIAIGAEFLKMIGVVLLVLTHTLPFVFASMVFLGFGSGAVIVATMNIFPDYFGVSSYPKIMGTVRLTWAFASALGAPLAGFVRESTGSYIPAFQVVALLVVAELICLFFATPPVHPTLKKPQPALETSSLGALE